MAKWIENSVIENALKTKDFLILENAKVPFCLSGDKVYCLLIREHAAWYIAGKGWKDGNYPPDGKGSGRFILNFFKVVTKSKSGFWFKVFIPLSLPILKIEGVNENYCEATFGSKQHRLNYNKIDSLMWDVMTGNAETEEKIELIFAKVWGL